MKVSIVVPIYNSEKYLYECLDSLRNQTYDDFEVVMVDDGSTDSSSKICDDFSRLDSRFKVIHKKNEGVNLARQEGINASDGEYITFLDSDDYFDTNFLENIISYTDLNYDVIQWGLQKELQDGNVELFVWKHDWELNLILDYDAIIWHSFYTKLIKRDLFCKNDFSFDKSIYIGEDLCFTVQLYSVTSKIFNIKNYAPYHYRFYENTMINMTLDKLNNTRDALLFIEKYLKNFDNITWKKVLQKKKESIKLNYICLLTPPDCNSFRKCFPEIKKITVSRKIIPLKRKVAFYLAILHFDYLIKFMFFLYRKKKR